MLGFSHMSSFSGFLLICRGRERERLKKERERENSVSISILGTSGIIVVQRGEVGS